ncbi:MAG: mechanosensitive ion channel [Thermomicrobiales bacterium]|nr:mechanosensitive ion channel [Thermomicrobiales bacterium]
MVSDSANFLLQQIGNFLLDLGKVVLILSLYLGIAWLFNHLVNGRLRSSPFFNRYGKNGSLFAFRLATVTVYIIAILAALSRLGVDTSGILTLVSAFTVAIGLSMQDVLRNLFAGMFMLAEKPFSVGDRIIVRNQSGTVQGIDVRTTMIRTDDGALLMVPNQILFTEILQNDSRFNRKAARFLITSKLNGEELVRRTHAIVADLEGVQLLPDSLQLVEHSEELSKWQVTFTVNGRKAATHQQLADALIAKLPDCAIARVDS